MRSMTHDKPLNQNPKMNEVATNETSKSESRRQRC